LVRSITKAIEKAKLKGEKIWKVSLISQISFAEKEEEEHNEN
jgi:hypothetical protein